MGAPKEYFCGIDPGKLGAYCILDEKGGIFDMQPMPSMSELQAIADWGKKPEINLTVIIEDVTPNPNWAMNSCWAFAQHVGQLHLIFPNAKRVYPRTWQAAMWQPGLRGDAKAKSLRSVKFYVTADAFIGPRKRVPHDGMIDAYLIARYYLANKKFLEAGA